VKGAEPANNPFTVHGLLFTKRYALGALLCAPNKKGENHSPHPYAQF
jgi:hypothetical protein